MVADIPWFWGWVLFIYGESVLRSLFASVQGICGLSGVWIYFGIGRV
jgi:hypothetical protein